MSCVDVPVHSSSLAHSPTQLDPGQHGLRIQGGSTPPSRLNPLAGAFDPGNPYDGGKQQGSTRGRGRGGSGGRGGLSSAMNRGGQQGGQQLQQPPARQPSGDVIAAGLDSGTSTGSSGAGGGASARGGGGGGAAAAAAVIGGRAGGSANANHLLNFQYESARGASGRGSGRGGSRPGSARGGVSAPAASARRYTAAKPQKYDKNKFLQANFRFLVSDAVDVSAYEADADKMFDWEDVLQVEMASSAPVQCPISLDSPPLCPQITPCGHVFSFPAIMHHLINHGGEQLRRSAPCPLCFAPVVARELRLVRVRRVVQPRAGDQLTLALIRRTRTSIIPQPVDPAAAAVQAAAAGAEAARAAAAAEGGRGGGDGASEPPSLFDGNPFAKFVVGGDGSELWRSAAEQLAACATELVAEGGIDAALEAPYVYGALDQLAARARRWAEHRAECLAGRGLMVPGEGVSGATEALGAEAEALVKKVFTAASSDVKGAREAAAKKAALEQQFPSLAPLVAAPPPAAPAPPPPATAGGLRPADGAAAGVPRAEATKVPPASGSGAGSIAAAAPPAAAPPAAATGAAPAAAASSDSALEQRLPFDAVFSEDEQDEPEGPDGAPPSALASLDEAAAPVAGSGDDGGTATAAAAAAAGLGPPADLGPLGGPSPPSADLLGSSPTTTRLNTPGMLGEFYTYQAVDGSWVFLNPLNLRCLLQYHGSYDSCPPVITGRLLELENVVQDEATRRRWRFLAHLPLAGAFKMCELAMTDLMPQEALAPFADELAAREKRRRRQRTDERRQAAADAAAAARAAAARIGPSAEELLAMPSLSQAAGGIAVVGAAGGGLSSLAIAAGAATAALAREMQLSPSEVAESIALQTSLEEAAAAAAAATGQPGGGVSFAHITKMGYAATGPALGSSPPPSGAWGARAAGGIAGPSSAGAAAPSSPWGGGAAAAATAPAGPSAGLGLGGPWGGGKAAATLKAAVVTPGKGPAAAAAADAEGAATSGGAKKTKSGKGTLLFSTGNQRKY